jgi:hypothetical protein
MSFTQNIRRKLERLLATVVAQQALRFATSWPSFMRPPFAARLMPLLCAVCLMSAAMWQAAIAQPSAAPGAPKVLVPMTAAEQATVLQDLAAQLQARFVIPEAGERYAAMLRQRLADRSYQSLTDPAAFARAVTADLQAVHADGHLALRLAGAAGAAGGMVLRRVMPGAPGPVGQPRPMPRRTGPPALVEARLIGEVAYLKFNAFMGNDDLAPAARSFLLANEDTIKAVVIDGRDNRGGSPDVMDAILPLLYAQAATLMRSDMRADPSGPTLVPGGPGGPMAARTLVRREAPSTLIRHDHMVTPDPERRLLQTVPVFYLTSKRTASVAEHLALAFKSTRRAQVIGETTAGAGHFGATEAIGERFAAFIPVGRSYDPATGQGWEGSGVTPDVAVPAAQALETALQLARAANVKTE